jgi:hypothetical protein
MDIWIKDYTSGLTIRELADKNNCSTTKIRNFLLKNNVVLRVQGQQNVIPDKESFKKDCENMRWYELEIKYGVSWSCIKKWKRKLKLVDGIKHDRKIIVKHMPDGCWTCISHDKHKGYPRTKSGLVVKILWIEKNGEFPDGKLLRHLCGKNWCVNPDHVVPGIQFENILDALLDGRSKIFEGSKISILNRAKDEGLIEVSLLGSIIRKIDGKSFDTFKYQFDVENNKFIVGE